MKNGSPIFKTWTAQEQKCLGLENQLKNVFQEKHTMVIFIVLVVYIYTFCNSLSIRRCKGDAKNFLHWCNEVHSLSADGVKQLKY